MISTAQAPDVVWRGLRRAAAFQVSKCSQGIEGCGLLGDDAPKIGRFRLRRRCAKSYLRRCRMRVPMTTSRPWPGFQKYYAFERGRRTSMWRLCATSASVVRRICGSKNKPPGAQCGNGSRPRRGGYGQPSILGWATASSTICSDCAEFPVNRDHLL